MPESFDTETVLKEILDVLRKHGIPAQTVAVNVSMPEADFLATFPQLETRVLHQPHILDGVPMLFRAQRRLPFAEIVNFLQQRILIPIEQFHNDLLQNYDSLTFRFDDRYKPEVYSGQQHAFYGITLRCQFSPELYEDYNILELGVNLH